eukprot:m.138624 g.138624  ORF g.138624 m.138624 type:complete len:304 (+) comp9963_c0_seq8:294-1205(+)
MSDACSSPKPFLPTAQPSTCGSSTQGKRTAGLICGRLVKRLWEYSTERLDARPLDPWGSVSLLASPQQEPQQPLQLKQDARDSGAAYDDYGGFDDYGDYDDYDFGGGDSAGWPKPVAADGFTTPHPATTPSTPGAIERARDASLGPDALLPLSSSPSTPWLNLANKDLADRELLNLQTIPSPQRRSSDSAPASGAAAPAFIEDVDLADLALMQELGEEPAPPPLPSAGPSTPGAPSIRSDEQESPISGLSPSDKAFLGYAFSENRCAIRIAGGGREQKNLAREEPTLFALSCDPYCEPLFPSA